MKIKLITSIIILALFTFISCKKEPSEPKLFDSDASIKIPVEEKMRALKSDSDSAARAQFIFEYGFDIIYTDYTYMKYWGGDEPTPGTIHDLSTSRIYYNSRDTINQKFIFLGIFVVDMNSGASNPKPRPGSFPLSEDMVLRAAIGEDGKYIHPRDYWFEPVLRYDTIAYIPNATLREGEAIVKKAMAEEDYETCYKMFDTHYKFIPITGPEYMELVRQGKN